MFVGVVTEDVPTGLVVLQFKLVLHVPLPETIVQSVAVRLPDIPPPPLPLNVTETLQSLEIAPVL